MSLQHNRSEEQHSYSAPVTEFKVLGPIAASLAGRPLRLGGTKQLTLLAALLIEHERVVPDERIVYFLWGDRPPRTVDAQLHTYVSRLRKQLSVSSDFFRVGSGYCMTIRDASLDYDDFNSLSSLGIAALKVADHARAAEYLMKALRLWEGPVLSNVTDLFAEEYRAVLEQNRIAALECRIEADLALGRDIQVLAELHMLTAHYPMHETFRDQFMRALVRCGRQADAIRTYHQGRSLLADELGVAPGARLQETFSAIIKGDPSAASRSLPSPARGNVASLDASSGWA